MQNSLPNIDEPVQPDGESAKEMFGRRERASPTERERGADLHASIALSLEDAIRGGARSVTVTRQETCRRCQGAGSLRTAESACPRCQGSGAIRTARGHMIFSKPCLRCGGTGCTRPG